MIKFLLNWIRKKRRLSFAERWGLNSKPGIGGVIMNRDYCLKLGEQSKLEKMQQDLVEQGIKSEIFRDGDSLKLRVFRE